ncbi:hypothetical protein D3C76_1009870 [compost metagenome]
MACCRRRRRDAESFKLNLSPIEVPSLVRKREGGHSVGDSTADGGARLHIASCERDRHRSHGRLAQCHLIQCAGQVRVRPISHYRTAASSNADPYTVSYLSVIGQGKRVTSVAGKVAIREGGKQIDPDTAIFQHDVKVGTTSSGTYPAELACLDQSQGNGNVF